MTEWMSVKDKKKLPKLIKFTINSSLEFIYASESVLVDWYFDKYKGLAVVPAHIIDDEWINIFGDKVKIDGENAPTHWMPLPELPCPPDLDYWKLV